MRVLILHIILVTILVSASGRVCSQFPTEGHNLDNPTFLDSTVGDYDVFFTAEWHWRKENTSRMQKMIEYLVKENSLNAIVVERSYDFGHWVNYFLATGDSLLLKEFLSLDDFFSIYHGRLYQNEYEFYRWLRKYMIDNDLSIQVIGIDLHAYWDEKPILWSFLKLTEQDATLQKPFTKNINEAEELIAQKRVSIHRMLKWFRNLKKASVGIVTNNDAFLNFIFSLEQSVKYAHGGKFNYREQQIAHNFKRYTRPGEKVFGQFGQGHTMLKPEISPRSKPFKIFKPDQYYSFTYLLNKDPDYQGKILSIGRVCFKCEDIGPSYGKDIFKPFMTAETFERLRPQLLKVPNNTIIDFRNTNEKMKANCQLLLVEFD